MFPIPIYFIFPLLYSRCTISFLVTPLYQLPIALICNIMFSYMKCLISPTFCILLTGVELSLWIMHTICNDPGPLSSQFLPYFCFDHLFLQRKCQWCVSPVVVALHFSVSFAWSFQPCYIFLPFSYDVLQFSPCNFRFQSWSLEHWIRPAYSLCVFSLRADN